MFVSKCEVDVVIHSISDRDGRRRTIVNKTLLHSSGGTRSKENRKTLLFASLGVGSKPSGKQPTNDLFTNNFSSWDNICSGAHGDKQHSVVNPCNIGLRDLSEPVACWKERLVLDVDGDAKSEIDEPSLNGLQEKLVDESEAQVGESGAGHEASLRSCWGVMPTHEPPRVVKHRGNKFLKMSRHASLVEGTRPTKSFENRADEAVVDNEGEDQKSNGVFVAVGVIKKRSHR